MFHVVKSVEFIYNDDCDWANICIIARVAEYNYTKPSLCVRMYFISNKNAFIRYRQEIEQVNLCDCYFSVYFK